MSDSWDEYLSNSGTDGVGTSDADLPDIAPQLDAAAVELDDAATATDWGNWNAATTDEYTASAQSEIAYANEAYASGWDDVGDAAMSRAGASLDTAADHAETADGYYSTADSNVDAAGQELTVAQDSLDTSSYDTAAVDTSSYDTAAVDTSSYDTAAVDTSSYDTGSDDSL